MLCKNCLTDTVSWQGPITALTHTLCSKCGGTDCQVQEPRDEGDQCPLCGRSVEYEDPENCSCHINPPCAACTSRRLTCIECGEFFE